MDVQIEDILGKTSNASSIHPASDSNDERNGKLLRCKTKIVCTLGPKSRELHVLEELLRSGMSVARFNFSHGSHEYHQETLDVLRQACANTQLMCAVLLDTKGPEIRTGMLEDSKPVLLTAGRLVTLTTDYSALGNENTIAMSYKKLAEDVVPGAQILIGDGSIVLEVLSCDVANGTVQAVCTNTATLGERKNVNLPGVIVDLPTITEKDRIDIVDWGLTNKVDFIAASFSRLSLSGATFGATGAAGGAAGAASGEEKVCNCVNVFSWGSRRGRMDGKGGGSCRADY